MEVEDCPWLCEGSWWETLVWLNWQAHARTTENVFCTFLGNRIYQVNVLKPNLRQYSRILSGSNRSINYESVLATFHNCTLSTANIARLIPLQENDEWSRHVECAWKRHIDAVLREIIAAVSVSEAIKEFTRQAGDMYCSAWSWQAPGAKRHLHDN